MSDCGKKTIRIRRKIYSFDSRFQIQNRTDKRGILMTEPVMFLTSPSTGFDVIKTSHILSPLAFCTNFNKFGVLHHHRVNNSKESLIRGKNSSSSGQSVT